MDCYRTLDMRRGAKALTLVRADHDAIVGRHTSANPEQTVPPSPVGGRWGIPATGPWIRGGSEVAWA